ncbi:YncE family protein [Pedobacter nutrimenti]|uniref:DNA-binding beta-propeller fold protein YncE n=1 Tax=Pedobacter nutrimenti TaxID=1241337 RepID=A0A318UZ09_9SPHI|nr:DUF5074 domain-containing protein [Pedobacter nutrimenti]PYF76829.1 hypothetical protein B0O44_101304 [Pedobacter nutrimenti]
MTKRYQNFNRLSLMAMLLGIVSMTSCRKDYADIPEPEKPKPVITGTKGIYMLCEGLMGSKNSEITYYDIETGLVEKTYFEKVNRRPLGETANDLEAYGSKMYCVISGIQGTKQSFVEVIDIATGKSLKTIPFNSATDGQMPRYVAFHKGKAYVSRYDGVVSRIDTASMNVDAELQLMNGTDKAEGLEQLAVANGKLYVTNSSHPFYQKGLKTKVTVIDLNTFKKTKDIEVGNNPVRIAAAENGNLFVITWNDYIAFNDPSLVTISSNTDLVLQTQKYDLGTITASKDQVWVTQDVYTNAAVKSVDVNTGKTGASLITDKTQISTLYGLTVNPFNKSVVVADAQNYNSSTGHAYVFSMLGKRIYDFETAGLPQHAVFLYNYK